MGCSANKVFALSISGTLRIVFALFLETTTFLVEGIAEVVPWADTLDLVANAATASVLSAGVGQSASLEAATAAAGSGIRATDL